MQEQRTTAHLTARLVDSLYVEAMVLSDEARTYFDEAGRAERDQLPPARRVNFSCEALKVTTRLMHVLAWLLTRRAADAGELSALGARAPERRLPEAAGSDPQILDALPAGARRLVEASLELYARVGRLDQDIDAPAPTPSPVLGLLRRLERAF